MEVHQSQSVATAKAIERSYSWVGMIAEKAQANFGFDYFIGIGLFFGVYFLMARAGLSFDAVSGFATLVWPPSGIALATLLIFGYRWWPGILLGAFLVNYMAGAGLFTALFIGFGNTLEAVAATYLLRTFGFENTLERVKSTVLFLVLGGMVCTLIGATVGVMSLWLADVVTADSFAQTWLSWWVGDMLGIFVIGGLLLNMRHSTRVEKSIPRLAEGVILCSLIILFNFTVFVGLFPIDTTSKESTALLYFISPLLIWAALRFGAFGASLSIFVTAVVAIWGTAIGHGPFVLSTLSHSLFLLQLFIGATAATVTVLSAAVSERLQVGRDLSGEKMRLEAVLRSIGDGVVVVDTEGKVLLINRETEKLLGVRAADVVGLSYETVVLAQDEKGAPLPPEKDLLRQALSSKVPFAFSSTDHYYLPRGGLKFPAALTVAPIFLQKKMIGAVKVFRDISPEKEVDRAKTEAISLASHQLWSPLASFQWYCDALLTNEAGALNTIQREHISEMRNTSERMMKLVTALLNVSRIELGVFSIRSKPVDIRELFGEVKHDLIQEIRTRGVKIHENFDQGDLQIEADTRLLRIIFQNLLSNAIKYSREGGVIHVGVEKEEAEWLFTVSDTGYGIPEEEQGKIFTKLFRATNAETIDPNGNGLGLYIVRAIVEAADGHIRFLSKPEEGTTFYIRFPKIGMRTRIGDYELYGGSSAATVPQSGRLK